MCLLMRFWQDDAGMILSAEAVVVGTLSVVGVTAGLSVVASAVNDELKDVALAIRSLDQSYCVPAQTGCGAMTAGSSFQQTPVEESLDELRKSFKEAERREESQAKRMRRQLQERRRRAAEDRELNRRQPDKHEGTDHPSSADDEQHDDEQRGEAPDDSEDEAADDGEGEV